MGAFSFNQYLGRDAAPNQANWMPASYSFAYPPPAPQPHGHQAIGLT
jgi:hypothetical protein